MNYTELHQQHKAERLFGRYITLKHIEPLMESWSVETIGHSVLGKPIYKYQMGIGSKKILMWSQMHGNESTTTKALFDFINLLHSGSELGKQILGEFTFCLLPMLNPDGAELYTRENANKVDLNRDSQNLTQPESLILRQVFEDFKPDYCYNLHDQRTIFGAGTMGSPATVSFLSPSYNETCDINEVRVKAMNVIVAMNNVLQEFIPNQVGRFDDSFNINCIGDTFQSLNVPTILFEAGHYPNDYEREETRKFIFIALVSGIEYLMKNQNLDGKTDNYLNIPQNKINFYDIVYRNVKINYDGIEKNINFAAQFKEVLSNGKVTFEARIGQVGNLENYFGHIEYDAKGAEFQSNINNLPNIDEKADFYLGKNTEIVNGLVIS